MSAVPTSAKSRSFNGSPPGTEGDEVKLSTKSSSTGALRKRVLPPLAVKTVPSSREKNVDGQLETVLPLGNFSNSKTAPANNLYKGSLPSLVPSQSATTHALSLNPGSSVSGLLPKETSYDDATSEESTWDSHWNTMFDVNGPTYVDDNQHTGATANTGSLSQEPPVSPLPPHITDFKHNQSTASPHQPKNVPVRRRSPCDPSKKTKVPEDKKTSSTSVISSFKQFRNEVQKCRNNNLKISTKLQDFFSSAFTSFKSINETFKKRDVGKIRSPLESQDRHCPMTTERLFDPLVQLKYVGSVHEVLLESPQETQKIVLKGIINCLLNEWRGTKSENEVRAYFILLQNPLFSRSSTYVIFAHLLRQIATLHEKEHTLFTHWFRRLSTPRFRPIVERIHQFVTLRLFPDKACKQQDIPPMSRCPWWIPSAMRVLTLLYNANNLVKPRLVSYREFYNTSLDHIDTMAEFKQWLNPASHPGFTFCDYPYVLSLCAKRHILRRDQERQMVQIARDELVASVRRRPTRPPDVNQLFLNIKVRRQELLQDSLSQIYASRKELKKKLRVEFIGEPGYDMGGLTKEWFLLLLRQVLSPDYGTFVHNEKTRTYWFATSESENFSDYFLVGVLMGLAIYNCITLDLRFPLVLYRKLLSPPQLPPAQSYPSKSANGAAAAPIGLVSVGLEDLKDIDADMAHGFEEFLSYEGNVEEDFCVTFEIAKEEFGILRSHLLKPSGGKIPVTNSNRREYVQCYLNWLINKSVYRQFNAFYQGFHTVCDSNALSLLCAEEVETLACGSSVFDIRDLKKFTTYEGFVPNDPTILHFWDVTLSMPRELQKKFLHFCTGSDRVPIGGMQDLKFKIIRAPTAQNMLPMAHTCFNQLLLPPYGSRAQLEQKLTIAVSNAEGFGLE